LEALKLEEQRKKEELDLTKDIVENHSPDGRQKDQKDQSDKQSTFSGMQIQGDALASLK